MDSYVINSCYFKRIFVIFFINVANLITPMECHDPMTRCSTFGHENERVTTWFIIMIIVISY